MRVGSKELAEALTAANMGGDIEVWLRNNDCDPDLMRKDLRSFVEMMLSSKAAEDADAPDAAWVAASLGFMIGFEAAKMAAAVDQLRKELE